MLGQSIPRLLGGSAVTRGQDECVGDRLGVDTFLSG